MFALVQGGGEAIGSAAHAGRNRPATTIARRRREMLTLLLAGVTGKRLRGGFGIHRQSPAPAKVDR